MVQSEGWGDVKDWIHNHTGAQDDEEVELENQDVDQNEDQEDMSEAVNEASDVDDSELHLDNGEDFSLDDVKKYFKWL